MSIEQFNISVSILLGQKDKSMMDLKLLFKILNPILQNLWIKIGAQSQSEMLQVCDHLELKQLQAHHFLTDMPSQSIYIFAKGNVAIENEEEQETIFIIGQKKQKKNRFTYLNPGVLIENTVGHQIFALEDSYFLMFSQQSQIAALLKHEQFLRQKRYLFWDIFSPENNTDKMKLQQVADSIHLYTYEQNEAILQQNQQLDWLYLVFSGTIQLCTKKNVICTLYPKDFFNEECSTSSYSAIVTSPQASVFKLDHQQLAMMPTKVQQMVEQSYKLKSYLRQKMVENHIVDLQVPQMPQSQQQRKKLKTCLQQERYVTIIKRQQTESNFESLLMQEDKNPIVHRSMKTIRSTPTHRWNFPQQTDKKRLTVQSLQLMPVMSKWVTQGTNTDKIYYMSHRLRQSLKY